MSAEPFGAFTASSAPTALPDAPPVLPDADAPAPVGGTPVELAPAEVEPLEVAPEEGVGSRRERREQRAREEAAREEEAKRHPVRLSRRDRKKLGRLRARKVTRVVRRVEPWAVLKVSLLFFVCLYVVFLVAGLALWAVASSTGTIASVESVIGESFGFKKDTFHFNGTVILQVSILAGLVMVIVGSTFMVVMTTLFNLIADLVGGVRVTVIEEETARPVV